MSEPAPIDHPEPASIEYATERTYIATSHATFSGIVLALLFGLIAAAISGIVPFFWIILKLPTYLFAPMLVQGVLLGAALAWVFHRLKLRGRAIAIVLAVVCGLASAFTFHYSLYVRNALQIRETYRQEVTEAFGNDPKVNPYLKLSEHPMWVFDQAVIFPQTRHHGFPGYLILRLPRVGAFSLIQIVLVVWMAAAIGKKQSSRPFCIDCGSWFKSPWPVAILPSALADPLVLAIQSDDPAEVLPLHDIRGKLTPACAVARVHRCPKCNERFVDVAIKTYGRYASERIIMPLRRVNAEMIEALRYEPPQAAMPVASEEKVTEPTTPPAPSEMAPPESDT